MALENIDFQSLVQQLVTQMVPQWKSAGFTEEDVQENGNNLFQMGLTAGQVCQQEGGAKAQDSEQMIPYTPESAQRVVTYFLQGMNFAVMKAFEQKLPSKEKWELMGQVALHVFEQSKQAIVATHGQENTPEVQISDEQIVGWVGNTAVEALLYYINEYEQQNGPITRTDAAEMPDLLAPEEPAAEEAPIPEPATPAAQGVTPPIEAQPQPQAPQTGVPEIHHKYAAVGLLLGSMNNTKQQKILSAFQPEEQAVINQYRNPEVVAQHLDLGKVAHYLRLFKDKLGQGKAGDQSRYASTVSGVLKSLPPQRLERLFQNERPYVRGYVQQALKPGPRHLEPYTLPPGVEESLLLYLHRNFPEEVSA